MNRTGGGLLAMVLLIAFFTGGGLPHGQSGTEAPSKSGATNTAAAKPKNPSNGTHEAKAQSEATESEKGFNDQAKKLDDGIQQAVSTSLSKAQQERISKELGESTGSLNLGFMIAIAPDPVQTHLSLSFDRYIDAVQEAVQASCFDFDRAVLPWDAESHNEDANPLSRETAQRFTNAEEEVPGILIFRKHHDTAGTSGCSEQKLDPQITRHLETLLVFVVGEMPTSGIERVQFLNALELAKHFTPADEKTHKRPLIILGPNFSGSLYSLQQLLIPETAQFAPITIASGEIEGKGPVDQFEASLRAAGLDGVVNFASFLESSAVLENALFRYACSDWKIKPSEFAILSETETAYGGQPVMPVSSDVCPGLDKRCAVATALSFPRGVYHVRTAYIVSSFRMVFRKEINALNHVPTSS